MDQAFKYLVQPGDSPWSIAQAKTGSGARWRELVDANPGKPRALSGAFASLCPGECLALPYQWVYGPATAPDSAAVQPTEADGWQTPTRDTDPAPSMNLAPGDAAGGGALPAWALDPWKYTQDVSDAFLLALDAMGKRVGIPAEFILEVWNSETGCQATNIPIGNQLYFGPMAILSTYVQGIAPEAFARFTGPTGLDRRLPYLEATLRGYIPSNHGKTPDRAAVLYALNFTPAYIRDTSDGNPPDSFVFIKRSNPFWAQNSAFQPYSDPGGFSIGTMARTLAAKRAAGFKPAPFMNRIGPLLVRYWALIRGTPIARGASAPVDLADRVSSNPYEPARYVPPSGDPFPGGASGGGGAGGALLLLLVVVGAAFALAKS